MVRLSALLGKVTLLVALVAEEVRAVLDQVPLAVTELARPLVSLRPSPGAPPSCLEAW